MRLLLWVIGVGLMAYPLPTEAGEPEPWTQPFEGEPVRPVALDDGGVIVGLTFPGKTRATPELDSVICLSEDGQRLWSYATQYGLSSGPTVGPDEIIFFTHLVRTGNIGAERLVALASDGSLRWSAPLASTPTGDLSIGADGMIVFAAAGVCAYSDAGSPFWINRKIAAYNRHASIGIDGSVLLGTSSSFISLPTDGFIDITRTNIPARGNWGPAAIDETGRAWAFNEKAELAAFSGMADRLQATPIPRGTPAIGVRVDPSITSTFCPIIDEDGIVYAVTGWEESASRLAAVYPDGRLKWAVTISNRVLSPPAVARGGRLFLGRDTEVLELSPEGEIVRSLDVSHPIRRPPVLTRTGNMLIVGTNQLTSLRPGFTFPTEAPWPMDRANPGGSSSRSLPPGQPERPTITTIDPLIGLNRILWKRVGRPASYEVFRTIAGTPSEEISLGKISSAQGRFDDTNASPGITYTYRLRASHRGGVSDFSEPIRFTTIPERTLWTRRASRIFDFLPGARGEVFLSETQAGTNYLTCLNSSGEIQWQKPGKYFRLALSAQGNLYVRQESTLLELDADGEKVRSLDLSPMEWRTLAQSPDGTLWVGNSLGTFLNLQPDFSTNWTFALPEPRGIGELTVSPEGVGFFRSGPGELSAIGRDGSLSRVWLDPTFEADAVIPVGLQSEVMLPITSAGGYSRIKYDVSSLKGTLVQTIPSAATPNSPTLCNVNGAWFTIAGTTNRIIYPSGAMGTSSNSLCRWNPDSSLAWKSPVSQSAFLCALTQDGGVILAQLGGYRCLNSNGTPRWSLESTLSGTAVLGVDGRLFLLSTVELTAVETTSLLADAGWVTLRGDSRASLSSRGPTSTQLLIDHSDSGSQLSLAGGEQQRRILLSSEDLHLWRRWGAGGVTNSWFIPPTPPSGKGTLNFFRAVEP